MAPRTLMTISTVGQKLGVPRQTLYRWIGRGDVHLRFTVDGGRVFTQREFTDLRARIEKEPGARNVLKR